MAAWRRFTLCKCFLVTTATAIIVYSDNIIIINLIIYNYLELLSLYTTSPNAVAGSVAF